MTTMINPGNLNGATVGLTRRSDAPKTARPALPVRRRRAERLSTTHLNPAGAATVATAEPNTAELLLASIDIAGRRAGGERNPWLATSLVLAGVLVTVMIAFLGALVLSYGL